MSFFGKLFGSDKAASALIEHAASGLDKLYYSSEERADDDAASRTEARRMVIEWLKNTQGQNLSRRLIALSSTAVWLMQFVIGQCCSIAAVWVVEPVNEKLSAAEKLMPTAAEKLTATADQLFSGAADMNSVMLLIFGFYFAAPHMSKFATAALNKFGAKN